MTVFGERRIEAGDKPARTSRKERYAMTEDSKVVPFRQPDTVDDPLTAVLRAGARRLLEQAIAAEVETFLAAMKDLKLPDGRDRVVRHGHGPERDRGGGVRLGNGEFRHAGGWRRKRADHGGGREPALVQERT
jgi:hypothetical protein